MIDTAVFWKIVEGSVLLVLGGFIARFFERQPRLLAFYGQIGQFDLERDEHGQGGRVHTHNVIIRNAGKLPARNVRIPHAINLQQARVHVSVFPSMHFTRRALPDGNDEILFETVVPTAQIVISYLYFPPLLYPQINLTPYSDEGPARLLNVLPTPQLPKWRLFGNYFLMAVGVATLIYLGAVFGRWVIGLLP